MKSPISTTLALICVVTATLPTAWAKRIVLNDTGMVACVERTGAWSFECAHSGQDADEGRDVTHHDPVDGVAGFSFRKVCRSGELAGEGSCPSDPVFGSRPGDWGCVHDNITGLTWEAKTSDGGLHDGATFYTNKGGKARDQPGDAAWLIATTNAEGLCGTTNWRLPDAIELQSLVDYGAGVPGRDDPFIDGNYFPNVRGAGTAWWSRNETLFNDKWAWFVDFSVGRVNAIHRFHRTVSAMLVHGTPRSESASPSGPSAKARDRFTPTADGSQVKDAWTGLVWRRCVEGMEWNQSAQTCDGVPTWFTWKEALEHAWARRHGGWRMPNIKELFSIVSLEHYSPAIDPVAFPNPWGHSFGYASSTAMSFNGEDLFVQNVYFLAGSVYPYDWDRWGLRLVRNRGRE